MNSLFNLTQDSVPSIRNKEGYIQRNGYSCGYFCVKAMVNVLGNKNDKNLVKSLRLTTEGTSQRSLVRVLRNRGVSASLYYDLSKEDIARHLKKGKYLIVYNHDEEHWLVLGAMSGGLCRFYDPENRWTVRPYEYVEPILNGFGIVCGTKCTK